MSSQECYNELTWNMPQHLWDQHIDNTLVQHIITLTHKRDDRGTPNQ